MTVAEPPTQILKGGEFLIKESSAQDTYVPHQFTEEQLMFADMTREFIEKRIYPNLDRIDKQEEGLVESLLHEAGELGLSGAHIPEEYGGMGVNIHTESMLTEILGQAHAFSVSFGAHTGIGTLPIMYFGTEAQKQKYLPLIAEGKFSTAYCLTEPGSGSDALGARTKATLSEDGKHYILEGQKMWITNAGFADLFTVFAKIDGKLFTAFLVDATSENIRLGAEEDKMGIKGSSTRQVFFEGVKVPVENVLGKIGKGHKIAFNVLNFGRYKLGVGVTGGSKSGVTLGVRYANERKQFGQAIANFGAIKHKIAEQATRVFVSESLNYRIGHLLHEQIKALMAEGMSRPDAKLKAAEEYSIECAISKVFGSETLDYVVDETVQIHGGYGYSEEFAAARGYRDARINRIFEGTNEINRLLLVGHLLKKGMRGEINIMGPAKAVMGELMSIPSFGSNGDDNVFAEERKAIRKAKKAVLMTAGGALQKYMQDIEHQQEVMMSVADMLIEIFAAESTIMNTEKRIGIEGEANNSYYIDMTKVFVSDAMERINNYGKHAICAFAEGDELRMMLLGLKRFTKYPPFNTVAARRRIAAQLIDENKYCF